jgi:DNA polymerase-1
MFLYGMQAKSFREYARINYRWKISLEQAKAFRKQFFERFGGLTSGHALKQREVETFQKVTNMFGRIRHLPEVLDSDKRMEAILQAVNFPVQSAASDIALMALGRVFEHLKKYPLVKLVGTVHDSILVEAPPFQAREVAEDMKVIMESLPLGLLGVKLEVPIIADVTISQYWGD